MLCLGLLFLQPAVAQRGTQYPGAYAQDQALERISNALYFQDAGQPVAAIVERLWADRYLRGMRDRADNQYRTWRLLERLTDQQQMQPPNGAPPSAIGWWELARATRAYASAPHNLATVLDAWESRHPDHPASESVLLTIRANLPSVRAEPDRVWGGSSRSRGGLAPARRIALVVPLSGAQGNAGRAIAEGVRAQNAAMGQPARIQEFDSAAQGPLSAYFSAINTRPDLVIGPLDKSAVTQIARRSVLVAPTLALNYAEYSSAWMPGGFYQFGLAPEAEAAAAAELAIARGQRRVAILSADDAWGQRVAFAFANSFEQLGGQVVTNQTYRSGGDINAAVQALIRPGSSQPLWKDRRGDGVQTIDGLLLGARSEDAALIHPLLRFHRAVDLPVYATGAVYTPDYNTERDADLRGMFFCDAVAAAPKPRDDVTEALIPDDRHPLQRLFAFGQDALLLSQRLDQLQPNDGFGSQSRVQGQTGELSLDAQRRVHRHPPCHQIARARLESAT